VVDPIDCDWSGHFGKLGKRSRIGVERGAAAERVSFSRVINGTFANFVFCCGPGLFNIVGEAFSTASGIQGNLVRRQDVPELQSKHIAML
jgi:hypothetical protein